MEKLITEKTDKINTSLWDAFINYIETIYYPGAIESLDTGLVSNEYESFKLFYKTDNIK